jgi:hypothetical protein
MPKRVFDVCREFGLHPSDVIAKAEELGIRGLRVASSILTDEGAKLLEQAFLKSSQQPMRPCLTNCRVVEVNATMTWQAALKHRVYSCPDTPGYDSSYGATALLLRNNATGRRILLNVEAVQACDLHREDFANDVLTKFHSRLTGYVNEVRLIHDMLDGNFNYRFYFLGTEPWPDEMQNQTTPNATPPTEWSAILSVLADSEKFFRWPLVGALLWPGCVRTQRNGEHVYPSELRTRLERLGIEADDRTNGPAIASFLASGGRRPSWGYEGWPIHHIFGGVDDGNRFTHSAGLVAAHPVAHYLVHRSKMLDWIVRREAFLRFGFDPNGVFGGQ